MEPEIQDNTKGADSTPRPIKSKYEFVMAASKEAERLNDHYRRIGVNPDEKVTVEAVRRITKGLSKVAYEDAQGPPEEPQNESTHFFGG